MSPYIELELETLRLQRERDASDLKARERQIQRQDMSLRLRNESLLLQNESLRLRERQLRVALTGADKLAGELLQARGQIETLRAQARTGAEGGAESKDERSQSAPAPAADGGHGAPSADRHLCQVCLDAPINCVLIPCGHAVLCRVCLDRMTLTVTPRRPRCPICRAVVKRNNPLYLS